MKYAFFLATALTFAGGATAMAQDARTACRSDAQKLCASAIGNTEKVVACLKANKGKLSDACKQAVAAR